ncbi:MULTISPECIES: hypothetical protein [Bacillus]|uniref:hypothetical protein n=1 Tax=Bacillus TaxID=1386 RepID=UPI00227DE66D|nr:MULTISPECIES: hypothetical protein [Bacillus]MCY8180875.1 hypothetical protein [Bacillus paralicheniformis]MCY8664862.1 hypothetical protein [Bacillus haynesii]MCY8712450.1 hypothetical protein [Bacillus haynesii]
MGVIDDMGFMPAQYRELKEAMTDMEIAEDHLYCSIYTLKAWKRRHGLGPQYNKAAKKFTVEEWKAMKKHGMSENEIMKAFGYRTLKHYINHKRKIGIPSLKKKIERTPELLDEIKGYLDEGMTIKALTPKLSVQMTTSTAASIIKEAGLKETGKG